ncbi:protease inhibitor I42 family protein [Ruficoccus amylovorans]|uniref:Protease inhibitor I42 family protein n=1 Tax=Ruficoccus amylovorans TaxID=1804625 RepID=A0A842HH16_9BACT|nr:protease inhibitor I42 family protein [Ruficoccus amylovorans]MBC2595288.1 protease inhibitor I42 family protein [Ruficoccus amylovorans]
MIALVFAGCQCGESSGGSGSLSDGQTLGMASNGETFQMRVGDTFSVSLPSNPSTGYSWQLDDSYKPVLTMPGGAQSQTFSAGTTAIVGAPGIATWTFKAAKAGETKLRLEYARAWEKDTPPTEVFEITVNVTE